MPGPDGGFMWRYKGWGGLCSWAAQARGGPGGEERGARAQTNTRARTHTHTHTNTHTHTQEPIRK